MPDESDDSADADGVASRESEAGGDSGHGSDATGDDRPSARDSSPGSDGDDAATVAGPDIDGNEAGGTGDPDGPGAETDGASDGPDRTDSADEASDDGGDPLETASDGPSPGDPADAPDDDRPEAQTDGEGYVGDRPGRGEPGHEPTYPPPDDDDVGGISTPPDDEEMPLADHIEEMVLRLAVVLLVASAATAIGLLWASDAIAYMWADIFSHFDVPPPAHVYQPLELWLTRIKVAALLGVIVGLPVFVYQTYLFMRPGLYPNERRYYLAAVPTSVVLGLVGMVYSYFLVLPVLFRYFTFYSEGNAQIAYALGETFNLIITLTGFLAVVFQIPLFILLAIMMGVTTRRWLVDKRLYFWAGFAVLAGMFTLDPTLMAAILVAITMIALFEGTLLLLKWVGRE